MAGADGGQGLAARADDVDHPATGDVPLEGATRLLLDLGPGGFRDRGQFPVQVVHDVPFVRRLPMPSEPSATGSAGGASRKSAVGTKNSPPVTAVEKSRIRSWLPGGFPMNMFCSICSMTSGVAQ